MSRCCLAPYTKKGRPLISADELANSEPFLRPTDNLTVRPHFHQRHISAVQRFTATVRTSPFPISLLSGNV
jgi:hypothetical protein